MESVPGSSDVVCEAQPATASTSSTARTSHMRLAPTCRTNREAQRHRLVTDQGLPPPEPFCSPPCTQHPPSLVIFAPQVVAGSMRRGVAEHDSWQECPRVEKSAAGVSPAPPCLLYTSPSPRDRG
eukprot:1177114-Rhodomonas_salina.1